MFDLYKPTDGSQKTCLKMQGHNFQSQEPVLWFDSCQDSLKYQQKSELMPEWTELVDWAVKVLEKGQIEDDKDGVKESGEEK